MKIHFQHGEVTGGSNVGGLVGYGYRQTTYNNSSYQNAYIQITNSYAIGKVISEGEAGGLIGQLANTYSGSTTVTNSYWTPETTNQDISKAGIRKNVSTMLYDFGYISWNFDSIWKIESGKTLAYLKNVDKPSSVNKENITYDPIDIEGEGTEYNPYIVKTSKQLQKIDENLEASYKLGADIDLTGVDFVPIGNSTYSFKGTLDGNGYTISNLTLNNSQNNVGLFGYNQGALKNVSINNFNVTGNNNVGGLAGYNNGTITNCNVTNSEVTGVSYVGMISGYSTGEISESKVSNSKITGTSYIGGLTRI